MKVSISAGLIQLDGKMEATQLDRKDNKMNPTHLLHSGVLWERNVFEICIVIFTAGCQRVTTLLSEERKNFSSILSDTEHSPKRPLQ